MLSRRSSVAAITAAVLLVGCTDDGGSGEFTPLDDEPASIEDVVQHLVSAPEFPVETTTEPQLAELRSENRSRRHHFFLAEVADGARLDGALARGAAVLLLQGMTLSTDVNVSVASLDSDVVTEITSCASPCTATGPAVVAAEDWLQGLGAGAGWVLEVPAPAE